jgi:phosphoribosylglycinamide formyltransferase 1
MPREPLRIGFLASHGGTSMRAVVAAIRAKELNAVAAVLICNNADAPVLGFAQQHKIPHRVINVRTAGGEPEAADHMITAALIEHQVELVMLSGYLRKLGPITLHRFAGRMLNIHPALLPRFGGRGMYGLRVHEAVLAAGEAVSGASIHLVDAEYDQGPVIGQSQVPVRQDDTAETLAARVAEVETALVVATLRRIADGELTLPIG